MTYTVSHETSQSARRRETRSTADSAVPFAAVCYPGVRVKLYDLDPGERQPRKLYRQLLKFPKNSVNKYEYDGELEMFRLDRALYSPMHYPGDYGFIPGTLADDGDPLDILVLVDEASFTGCLMEARPVGVLRMIDGNENDEKILAIPDPQPPLRKHSYHGPGFPARAP